MWKRGRCLGTGKLELVAQTAQWSFVRFAQDELADHVGARHVCILLTVLGRTKTWTHVFHHLLLTNEWYRGRDWLGALCNHIPGTHEFAGP